MTSGIEHEYVFVPFEADIEEYTFSLFPGFLMKLFWYLKALII